MLKLRFLSLGSKTPVVVRTVRIEKPERWHAEGRRVVHCPDLLLQRSLHNSSPNSNPETYRFRALTRKLVKPVSSFSTSRLQLARFVQPGCTIACHPVYSARSIQIRTNAVPVVIRVYMILDRQPGCTGTEVENLQTQSKSHRAPTVIRR